MRLGANLEIAYFDQLRRQLDESKSVQHNVADGYDTLQIGDKTQHVIGYLKNFLFTPERSQTPVRFLSGGERNRVLLAKLFAKTGQRHRAGTNRPMTWIPRPSKYWKNG